MFFTLPQFALPPLEWAELEIPWAVLGRQEVMAVGEVMRARRGG